MPLKTTTIGAYPKPKNAPVRDWFLAHHSEEERKASPGLLANWRPREYEIALQEVGPDAETLFLNATRDVINDQVDAGIDVPTDGEIRRENYIFYQCRQFEGISFDKVTHKVVRQGAHEADLPTIVGPIRFKKTKLTEDWKAAQQFTSKPVKMTMPGPLTIADSLANEYYSDSKQLGSDLGDALNKEVRALAAAGCRYIQIDEPLFARKSAEAIEYGLDNRERAFYGISDDVVRVVHICCGYPNALDSSGYMKADPDAYFRIADAIERSTIDEISIEDAHRHNDLSLLQHFRTTTIVLGAVDSARSRIETVDEIRERLKAALQYVDIERLVAAPDCGLGFLTREMAIAKMTVLSHAARSI
jgi:5-methyltetrahydropteroyltriglutamate--homocysteine methyltransferase